MYVSRFELKKCWYTVYDNAHCQKMHKTPFENFPQQSWALAHCCKNPQSVSFFNSALQSWALTNTAATTRQIIDYCIMSIFVVATQFLDTETFTCFAFFILLIYCNWSIRWRVVVVMKLKYCRVPSSGALYHAVTKPHRARLQYFEHFSNNSL